MSVPFDKSWLNFLDRVSRRTDSSWLFRGQSDASWGLAPNIARSDVTGPAGYVAGDERQLFNDFKREAMRFEGRPSTEMAWLAVAQHHGLPTRLLDWSSNPLVAAWFAVSSENVVADGAVHMIRVSGNTILDDVADPFYAGLANPLLVRVPPEAARITAQEGLFTLHSNPTVQWIPSGPSVQYFPLRHSGNGQAVFPTGAQRVRLQPRAAHERP